MKPSDITYESWAFLRSVYSRVEDIDLFVGGLAETPAKEAAVGPTFSCIIGIQFTLLMDGDRSRCILTLKQSTLSPDIFTGTHLDPTSSRLTHTASRR